MDTITTIASLLKSNGSARPVMVALTQSEVRLIAMAPDLAAEVLRLRAALAVFADTKSYLTNGPCDPESPKFSALKIARAALKTKGTE